MAKGCGPLRALFVRKISLLVACFILSLCQASLYLSPAEAQTQCTSGDPNSTDPCYAQNNDILAGQRSILPNDDLVVNTWSKPFSNDLATLNQVTILTSQEMTSTEVLTTVTFQNTCLQNGTPVTQSLVGRVFFMPNDVIVRMQPSNNCDQVLLTVTDPKNSSNNSSIIADAPGASANTVGAIALADFDRDGYQDVFFINTRIAQVYTAKCNNDPFASCTKTAGNSIADGLRLGAQRSMSLPPYASPPVTGDFNGDGIIDVAWPTHDSSGKIQIRFISVCPAANVTVLGQNCSQPFQLILASPAITTTGTAGFTSERTPKPYIALTANNFDGQINTTTGIATAELLVALVNSDQKKATLTVYKFDQNLVATAAATLTDFPGGHNLMDDAENTLQIFLANGPLDADSPRPQAVFASTINTNDPPHRGYISVITFDENLTMTPHETRLNQSENSDKKTRIFGLAVGRFDPPDDSTGATNFDQQLAVLVDFNGEKTHVQLFKLPDGGGFSDLALTSHSQLQAYPVGCCTEERYYDTKFAQIAALSAGDLQGRSLLLGAPTKITVAQTQPDIILGLPPMHVDFITPPEETAPRILNVTVFPSTFNTAYDFTAAESTKSSRQHTTSYTTAYKETVESKVVLGSPKASNVTVKQKEAFTQTHQQTVTKTYNTYSSRTDSFATQTQFDDLVAATSLQMNIYSYPVIGQYVCPEDEPDDCSDPQPLTVQYSGPDNIYYTQPADAGNFEWYQPITEPGNIFSYPGSQGLLEFAETGSTSGLDLLSITNVFWDSQSEGTESVHWSAGNGSSVSSGSVNSVSYDTSTSVSTQVKGVVATGSDSVEFDYNESDSNSTLNTSSVQFDESTGVVVHHGVGSGGAASNTELKYAGQTFIFGLPKSENVIQTDVTVPTTVQAYGRIEVAHTADMLTPGGLIKSGDWWKQTYTVAPDVALNHPQRWLQKLPTAQNPQQVMFNCPIGFTSGLGIPSDDPGSCTSTTTQPNPVNVSDAPFYVMKGFFILPENATSGPTTTLATLGDVVTLQARVYNYSLKNMDPGTQVHVRFYAQPWDATRGQFASGSGKFGFAPALFLGEDIIASIPAFCGGSEGEEDSCAGTNPPPNWTLAQVQWDTGLLGPQVTATNWKFWVVVWMTNSSGQLVSEIPQHGLTAIPPQSVDSLAEIAVETYSNNLGFYNQVFTLLPPTAAGTLQASAPKVNEQQFVLESFDTPDTVLRDRVTTVRIHHRASGRAFDYVRAYLYEGDPLADGKLLDMDIIPLVPQDSTFVVPFRYQPRACGARKLFVQAAPVNGGKLAEATFDVSVTLDPLEETGKLIAQLGSLPLHHGTKQSLLAKVQNAARSFQRGNRTAGLNQLNAFTHEVRAQSGEKIPAETAAGLIAAVEDLGSCL